MNPMDLVQWPAMLVTVLAAWLTGSTHRARRRAGFWCFLLSNGLWIVWGVSERAYALVILQLALAFMNVRGAESNDADGASESG